MFTILVLTYAGIATCSIIGVGLVAGPPRVLDAIRRAREPRGSLSVDELATMRFGDDGGTPRRGAVGTGGRA